MKVVVVGCTHAGTAAVVNIKENYPDSEVVIYEKNNNKKDNYIGKLNLINEEYYRHN